MGLWALVLHPGWLHAGRARQVAGEAHPSQSVHGPSSMRYRALHALPFPSIQNSFAFAYAPLVSPPNSDSFPRNQFSCAEVLCKLRLLRQDQLTYDLAWIARGKNVRRNITRNHASRSDGCPPPDRYARIDNHAATNPD